VCVCVCVCACVLLYIAVSSDLGRSLNDDVERVKGYYLDIKKEKLRKSMRNLSERAVSVRDSKRALPKYQLRALMLHLFQPNRSCDMTFMPNFIQTCQEVRCLILETNKTGITVQPRSLSISSITAHETYRPVATLCNRHNSGHNPTPCT
jgi:hypothetical protein